MDQNCDLYLPLPEQKKASKADIKIALENFGQTLSDLPLGNQEQAAKEIFDILFKSNKIALKVDERRSLLNEIEKPTAQILNGLHEKIKDVSPPIGRSDERVAKVLVAIHYELALAYRCLFSSQPIKGFLRAVDKADYANSIRHTVFHLGEILRTKYSVFSNPSGSIWQYIYAFFICAHTHGIDGISSPHSELCRFSTVEEVFKSILLLSISSPLTMRSREFDALYQIAPELIKYIDLRKINCGEKYTDLMTFNLSGTEPPKKQFATGCDSCSNASNCFAVSTMQLIDFIDEQQKHAKDREKPTLIHKLLGSPNQVINLKKNLSGSARAGSAKRIKGEGLPVDLVVGFSDAYTFLNESNDKVDDADDMEEASDWETIGDESISVEISGGWTATGIIRAGLRKISAKMINRSSGGYCLYVDTAERINLRVGELAVAKEMGKHEWQVAEIKWVSGSEKRVDFGINLLEGAISIGSCRPIHSESTEVQLDCMFLADDSNSSDRSIRVITASHDFHRGDQLLADFQGEKLKLTITRINTHTSGYAEYSCDLNTHDENTVKKQESRADEGVASETDFESIWDML